MGEPALWRLKVRHYEVDSYGHVNHANYAHYFETARIEALEAVGLSLGEMQRQGYLIFAAGLSIKYRAPARAGETLEIITYIREIRGARSLWVQEIREAGSQRVVATAEVTGALLTCAQVIDIWCLARYCLGMRPQGSPEELERRRRCGIEVLQAGAAVMEGAR